MPVSRPFNPRARAANSRPLGVMKFAALLQLPYDKNTGIVDLDDILAHLPNTPLEVAKQFFADHGRNGAFQAQYGRIDLNDIIWQRTDETASVLSKASVYPRFRNWFESVGRRAEAFAVQGWKCIDSRKPVQAHWKDHGTWLIPPVLLQGILVSSSSVYHLAEGHTRVGLLAGLASTGILAPESKHTIWLGTHDA